MKYLFVILSIISSVSYAGTVYRDKIVPVPTTNSVCMIEFQGRNMNAFFVRDVIEGSFDNWYYETTVKRDFWFNDSEYKNHPYKAVRVTMIDKTFYEFKSEDLNKRIEVQKDILNKIKNCK